MTKPMTPADRARLYRRRKSGVDTTGMSAAEIASLLRVHQKPGPAPELPGLTRRQRKMIRDRRNVKYADGE